MPIRRGRRFFEIIEEEGLQAALQATTRFMSSMLNPTSNRNRLRFLRIRAGGSTVICDVNGSKMALDLDPETSDPLDRALALRGIREPASTKTFHNVLADIKRQADSTVHVFDVGAHIGYFPLLEAHVLGDHGKIYALEPEPENAARLERNIELNGYSQIEVLQLAAGAERTEAELHIKEKRTAHRMPKAMANGDYVSTIGVNVYPLDDLIEERDIPESETIVVRMDIEGYEGYAFQGMTELLDSDRPVYVFVEIHDREYDPKTFILDSLKDHGFRLEYVSYDGGETVTVPQGFEDIPDRHNIHVMASRP